MNSALPSLPEAALEEYKTLRDETARRVDARNQLLSYTLVFAASMYTLGLGASKYEAALLVYPIVSFFFAISFAYNSLMLIEIGAYIRKLEANIPGLGWAAYLKGQYKFIEPFEIIATAGLFVGTQVLALVLYESLDVSPTPALHVISIASWGAVLGTLLSILYAVSYHRLVLQRHP